MYRKIIYIIICSFWTSAGYSQVTNLALQHMVDSSGIALRWVPTNFETWEEGIGSGYILSRKTVFKETRILSESEQSESEVSWTFAPWEESRWKDDHDATDDWEMVAAGMLYGFLEEDSNPSFDPVNVEDRVIARENRWAIALHAANHSITAARKLGLYFHDKDVDSECTYIYSLSTIPDPSRKTHVLVSTSNYSSLDSPIISHLEWGDREVALAWDHYGYQDQYVSYEVEQSLDGGSTWRVRNRAPVTPALDAGQAILVTFLDSLPDNNLDIIYRVRGLSPFGKWGPFSKSVAGSGVQQTVFKRPFLNQLMESTGSVKLEWVDENETASSGYNVYRSAYYDGPYEKITPDPLGSNIRNFIDYPPSSSPFYYVTAIGPNGMEYPSLKQMISIQDVAPPAVPSGLVCVVDTVRGGIQIDWDSVEDLDLEGYRVFASYRKNDGYQDISNGLISENAYFLPTEVKRKGETLYFAIQSQDIRFNRSPFSNSCAVTFLDIHPPIAPVIRETIDNRNQVKMRWVASPSPDVEQYRLQRSSINYIEWRDIMVLEPEAIINEFVDRFNLTPGTTYRYRIQAIDTAMNSVFSEIHEVEVWNDKLVKAPQNLSWYKDNQAGQSWLVWQHFSLDQIDQIEIYRKSGDVSMLFRVLYPEEMRDFYQSSQDKTGQFFWPIPEQFLKDAFAIRVEVKNRGFTVRTEWVEND